MIYSRFKQTVACLALLFLVPWAGVAENLLQNGGFEQGEGNRIPDWKWPAGAATVCRISTEGAAEGRQCLHLTKAEGKKENVWLGQAFAVVPGVTYHVRFKAKGWGSGDYNVYSGSEIKGEGGKWLEFIGSLTISSRNSTWPTATVPEQRAWRDYETQFTAPPGAVTACCAWGSMAPVPLKPGSMRSGSSVPRSP